jgi:hypothetical protein
MTMMVDAELDERLGQLEARVPGAEPPAIRSRRRAPRILGGSLAGTILILVAATTVVGGVVIVSGAVRGWPGVESFGQPLFGAGLECMSPPEAAAYLTDHGFTDTVWQVERDGSAGVQVSTPPEHGYVIPGSIIDGVLYMIVDQRSSATGTGNCFGDPMQ